MREVLDRFLNEYIAEKAKPLTGNPFAAFVRNDIPQAIYDTGIVTLKDYVVTGGVGQGNWAMVPWIGIFDRKITVRATKGVYAVYLLAKDGKTLYLTFNQGCTDIRKNHSKRETIRIMRQKAGEIASSLDARGFDSDEDINLGEGLTELAELYQKGTIFYKKYEQGKVPSESELQDDLKKMMDIYKDYVVKFENTPEPQGEDKPGPEGTNEVISIKDSIESIKSYISAAGFTYPDGVIENFYLSLKSKPFVILAGTSGTGKTKLVRLFAEAVGATSESGGGNGRFKLVSVRPDWSDSSDLFGHENLKGEFVAGAIIDFVKRASEDLKHPYFLCFDEMNLARVEYYLSDFLSIIETRKRIGSELVTDEVLLPRSASSKYGKIILPENLYVIGTVNMDETTFPFSKKVLDRANTIEFSYVDLEPSFDINAEQGEILNLGNEFLKAEYLVLKKDIPYELQNYAADICVKLQEINDILQKAQAHVGYRVRDEIVFYMLNNKSAELLDEEVALDNEIMQKILPRIQGSSASIRNLLCDLFKEFAGDYTGLNQASVSDQMQEYMKAKSCRYPKSAAKICYMMRRFEEDGFTSYWL